MKIEVVPSTRQETHYSGLFKERENTRQIRGYRLKLWLTARTSFRSDTFYTSFEAANKAVERFHKKLG